MTTITSRIDVQQAAPELYRAMRIVHVANQVVKYSCVYCPGMEIDIISPNFLTDLGLPPQLESLLDSLSEREAGVVSYTLTPTEGGTRFERSFEYRSPNLLFAILNALSLRARVEALDGSLSVASPENGGTVLEVRLPCG